VLKSRHKQEVHAVDSYRKVFNKGNALSPEGKRVLSDLQTFCGINSYDNGGDSVVITRMAGRREVYNWIMENIFYDQKRLRDLREYVRAQELEAQDNE
jgi:hypothetical protein